MLTKHPLHNLTRCPFTSIWQPQVYILFFLFDGHTHSRSRLPDFISMWGAEPTKGAHYRIPNCSNRLKCLPFRAHLGVGGIPHYFIFILVKYLFILAHLYNTIPSLIFIWNKGLIHSFYSSLIFVLHNRRQGSRGLRTIFFAVLPFIVTYSLPEFLLTYRFCS